MIYFICSGILKLLGWKITGRYPEEIKKNVLIVAPHTSNWDFPLGLLVREVVNPRIKFVGKHTLFKPPFGFIFRWLGGIPVVRSKKTNFVQAVSAEFKRKEELSIVLAPEGTRKKVTRFKSGFYYIAVRAQVPIIPVKFDFGNKVVDFGKPIYLKGEPETEIPKIENYFKGVRGKNNSLNFE